MIIARVRDALQKMKARKRLKRIEKATKITLMPRQRDAVLNPMRPEFDYAWGRGSGKSTTAIFWTLMWRKEPISRAKEQAKLSPERLIGYAQQDRIPAIPDPDATDYRRWTYTIQSYMQYSVMCTQAGIEVSTVTK